MNIPKLIGSQLLAKNEHSNHIYWKVSISTVRTKDKFSFSMDDWFISKFTIPHSFHSVLSPSPSSLPAIQLITLSEFNLSKLLPSPSPSTSGKKLKLSFRLFNYSLPVGLEMEHEMEQENETEKEWKEIQESGTDLNDTNNTNALFYLFHPYASVEIHKKSLFDFIERHAKVEQTPHSIPLVILYSSRLTIPELVDSLDLTKIGVEFPLISDIKIQEISLDEDQQVKINEADSEIISSIHWAVSKINEQPTLLPVHLFDLLDDMLNIPILNSFFMASPSFSIHPLQVPKIFNFILEFLLHFLKTSMNHQISWPISDFIRDISPTASLPASFSSIPSPFSPEFDPGIIFQPLFTFQ